jgi:hypothetical protein
MSNKLIGTNPNQVPSNADLGTLAYQDADSANLGTLLVTDKIGIDTSGTDTLNSPYLFTVADEAHGVAIDYVSAYPTKPGGLFSTAGGSTWPFNQYGNMILTTRTDYGGYYDIALVTASTNNTPEARLVVKHSGKVGIGTTSPLAKLHVQGNAVIGNIQPYETTDPSNSGATLHVHNLADDGADTDGKVNFGDETQVIISTGAIDGGPQGYQGSLWFGTSDHPAGGNTLNSAGTQWNWKVAGIASKTDQDTGSQNASYGNLEFYTKGLNNTPDASLAMIITESQNVGIGNASPSSLYWPNGSTGGLFLQAGGLLSAYNAGTNLSQNWYYNAGEKFIGNGGASRYVQAGQEHVFSRSTTVNAGGAGAGLTWSESLKIDATGNVGIGSGTPESTIKLDVSSGATHHVARFRFSDDNNGASNNILAHEYHSGIEIENVYSGAAPSANGTKIAKLSFSTVTAGGYGAHAQIHTEATSNSYNAGELVFSTGSNSSGNNTEHMRIGRTGNVGIGTDDPKTTLHVEGSLQKIEHPIINVSSNQWSLIGQVTGMPQNGSTIRVRFNMHSGYNAADAQDYTVELIMKTANGSSTGPGGAQFNSWWYKLGNSGADPRFKWVRSTGTDNYSLYMWVPAFAGGSHYIIEKSHGVWTHSGAVNQSDPGNDSALVLEAANKLGIFSPVTVYGDFKTTGGVRNNGVREYAQYIDNLHNNATVNFDVPIQATGAGYTVYYECMYNHFGNTTYGSWQNGFFSFRSLNNSTYASDIIKTHGNANSGYWTVTMINAGTSTPMMRFTKSAGSYSGNGDGHIFVRGGTV